MRKISILLLLFNSAISIAGYSQGVSGSFSAYYPAQDATIYDRTSLFEWSALAGAQYYKIQIASDADFTAILYESAEVTQLSVSVVLPNRYTDWCYWRIVVFSTPADFIYSTVRRYKRFTPKEISGMAAWFSADSVHVTGAAQIDSIYDKSGNNRHALQGTAASQPSYVVSDPDLNNQPSIYFNGTNRILSDFQATLAQPNTIFAIWRKNDFQARTILDGINNNMRHIFYSNTTIVEASATGNSISYPKSDCRDYMLSTILFKTTAGKLYENSVLKTSGNNGAQSLSGLSIGSDYQGNRLMLGNIPEILVYHKELTATEQAQVETYIRYQYFPQWVQPPVSLGPDIKPDYGFCDVVLHAGANYASYLWSTGETTESISVGGNGTYSVTVTDTFGLASSDEVEVVFSNYFDLKDTVVCYGDTARYRLPSSFVSSFYSVTWPDLSTGPEWKTVLPGTYSVMVTDTNGCSFTDEFTVALDSLQFYVDFSNRTSYCGGDTIWFAGLSGLSGLSYQWQDGSTNDYYIARADELVWAEVTNERGCRGRDSLDVTISGLVPLVNFSSSLTCFGQEMDFTNQSVPRDGSTITGYHWDFGNNTSSTGTNPSVLYGTSGFYVVTLEAETSIGCKGSIRQNVFVHSLPVVNFSPQTACQNDVVPFVNLTVSESEINYTKWDFGNGDISLQYTPQYVFSDYGTYQVTLTERSIYGCTDSVVKAVEIRHKPTVSIETSSLCINSVGYFIADVQTEEWNPVQQWEWSVNGTPVSNQPTYATLLTSLSPLHVVLDVKALDGCGVHVQNTFTTHPVPVAGFENADGCLNTPYHFVNTSTDSSSLLHSVWNIDGHISTLSDPVYTFTGTGTYPVKLTVTNAGNCKQEITKDVLIHALPDIDFIATYSDTLVGTTLLFDNLSSQDAVHFLWDFGDGGFSTEYSPLHTYAAEGNYQIVLTGTTETGCRNSNSHPYRIVYPVFDVAVQNLKLNQQNGFIQPSVQVLNQGNRTLTRIDFIIGINEYTFQEHWNGVLNAGEIMTFETASKISTDNKKISILCITASLGDLPDSNPENNTACKYDQDAFIFYSLSPNPAQSQVVAKFYLPGNEAATLEIQDISGKKVYSELLNLSQGLHTYPVSVEVLPSGMYFFSIYNSEKVLKTEKFIKF